MKVLLRTLAGLAVIAGVLVMGVGTASAHGLTDHDRGRATCRGGTIAPGTYDSLTIRGFCSTPTGKVIVRGNLEIDENAALDAHVGTLIVFGNVHVERNAVFALGCLESGCTSTNDFVRGNVDADGALAVIFHHNFIGGSVSLSGGGGGVNCKPSPLLQGSPVFSDFEDNAIGRNLSVAQLRSCWMGIIRNHVRGNVLVIHNVMADPDANEVTTNVIGGNLACFHNSPPAQFGDAAHIRNVVGGHKLGECTKL